jgi:GTP-binding protein EngB required for normal cell division
MTSLVTREDVCIYIRKFLLIYTLSLRNLADRYEATENENDAQELNRLRQENVALENKIKKVILREVKQTIETFEDLQRLIQQRAEAFVRLATKAPFIPTQYVNIGFIGKTSSGKSTLINSLFGEDLAKVGAGATTTEIEAYEGLGYKLYDTPGLDDDLTYLDEEHTHFWKLMTARVIVVTNTMKEMTRVLRFLDGIHLRYDIVVNKFDMVEPAERKILEATIRQQIIDIKLQGVNKVWFLSAGHPRQFADWNRMIEYFTNELILNNLEADGPASFRCVPTNGSKHHDG